MHDIANCNSRLEQQPTYSANKENGNADDFGLPSMRRGPEIGSEAEVKGSNHDKERGPEYLFPSSLEDSANDKNGSNRAEQTDD
jgi:hypothetical protein